MKKFIKSFITIDAAGKEYKIDYYQEFQKTQTLSGTLHIFGGEELYRCESHIVTKTGNDTFQVGHINTKVK